MMLDLEVGLLSTLTHLPQTPRIMRLVQDLWHDPQIVALWLGGSLARGAGDRYSDVDLRVAVDPRAFTPDRPPAAAQQLEDAAVGILPLQFGADATLFHMLLATGEIYDLFVQTTQHEPTSETRLVLACRDDTFGAKLSVGADPVMRMRKADAEVIRQVIVNFWIGQQKHQKVLFRDLLLLSWFGENLLRQDLIRLWYVLATGDDCGPVQGMTIHSFSSVVRTVQQSIGPNALALLGQPLRSAQEIIAATARTRAEVSRVGREIAVRLGFDYPEAVQATVQQSWQQFQFRNSAVSLRG